MYQATADGPLWLETSAGIRGHTALIPPVLAPPANAQLVGEGRLLDLVEPVAWKREPATLDRVYFRASGDEGFARLVRASLRLENDRIRWAPLFDSEVLVEIEAPSYFVLQQALEDDALEVFVRAADTLLVAWGSAHPLAEMWPTDGAWTVLGRRGRSRVAEPQFKDVYDAVTPQHGFVVCGEPGEPSKEPPRIVVPLALTRRSRPRTAELWLIEDENALGRLLEITDSEDLAGLLLAVLEGADGQRKYVAMGDGDHALGGQAYARHLGLSNLLIPVDCDLVPRLRRDQYKPLFGLQRGVLTLVRDEGLIRIKESAFGPISRFVDYAVAEHVEALEAVIAGSVFELGPYLNGPSRPDLLGRPPAKTRESRKPPQSTPEPTPTLDSAQPDAGSDSMTARLKRFFTRRAQENDSDEGGLDPAQALRETELERALASERPTGDDWLELADLKQGRGQARDAAMCFEEALWLVGLDEPSADLRERLAHASRAAQVEGSEMLAAVMRDGVRDDAWVTRWSARLRGLEPALRKKTRWLAWREILRTSRDGRAEARVKEALLIELDAEGVASTDVPGFIQNIIVADHARGPTEHGDDADLLAHAQASVARVSSALEPLCTGWMRAPVLAMSLRAHHRASMSDAARGLKARLLDALADDIDPESEARARLYYAETLRGNDQLEEGRRADAAGRRLGNDGRERLRRVSDSLAARSGTTTPAELLREANTAMLFPEGPLHERGPLFEAGRALQTAFRASNTPATLRAMEQALQLAAQGYDELFDDGLRDVSRLVRTTTELARKLAWGEQGAEVVRVLRRFARTTRRESSTGDDFYYLLLRLGLADGLCVLGEAETAVAMAGEVCGPLCDYLGDLDFLDVYGLAVSVLEAAPVAQRGETLGQLTARLADRTNRGQAWWVDKASRSLSPRVMMLVDQLLEAGSSQGRLALTGMRRYRDRDELIIRQRLWRDHPSQQEGAE